MGRLKQSWRVRVDRSRATETLADGEKASLPHSIHVSWRQELGCLQPSNAFPQLLAGTGRSCWPTLRRAAKHQRHQHLALPHMASGEETSISATQGIPTGSLRLTSHFPVDSFDLHPQWKKKKKEQNRMLQVCYLISMERQIWFGSTEGFISIVQREQFCWSNSVLGIVSVCSPYRGKCELTYVSSKVWEDVTH